MSFINLKNMKHILILGHFNSCRSQMVEGFIRYLAREPVKVESAGVKTSEKINSFAIDVMREVGIDISDQIPKLFKPEMAIDVEVDGVFIAVGKDVQENCEFPLVWNKIKDWDLDNPSGSDITFFQDIRERIHKKVNKLFEDLKMKYYKMKEEEED